jgi:hypothetical protein
MGSIPSLATIVFYINGLRSIGSRLNHPHNKTKYPSVG